MGWPTYKPQKNTFWLEKLILYFFPSCKGPKVSVRHQKFKHVDFIKFPLAKQCDVVSLTENGSTCNWRLLDKKNKLN